jgi:methionine-rich copper-binding protein CopC
LASNARRHHWATHGSGDPCRIVPYNATVLFTGPNVLKRLLATATLVACLAPAAIHAHARLVAIAPAAGATLANAPTQMTLQFAAPVRLATLRLFSGVHEVAVAVDRSAAAATQIVVPLPPLPGGRWQVRWTAASPDDGHVMKGTSQFTILAPTAQHRD